MTAYIAGLDVLYKTIDRGESWEIVPYPPPADTAIPELWESISCTSPLDCWMVGSSDRASGRVLHTTDGGQSWSRDAMLPDWKFAVYAADSANLFVTTDRDYLFFTHDGGEHWVRNRLFYPWWYRDAPDFRDVVSPTPMVAHVLSTNTIFTTTDGGYTFVSDSVMLATPIDIYKLVCVRSGGSWGLDRDHGVIYHYEGPASGVATSPAIPELHAEVIGGELSLRCSPVVHDRRVAVIDLWGRTCLTLMLPGGSTSLRGDIVGLASGAYFVRVGGSLSRFEILK